MGLLEGLDEPGVLGPGVERRELVKIEDPSGGHRFDAGRWLELADQRVGEIALHRLRK